MKKPKSIDDCFKYDGMLQLPRGETTIETVQAYKCKYCPLKTVREYREGHMKIAHREIYNTLDLTPKYLR